MSAEAAVQLRRLLALIPRLSDGKPHEMDKVAKLAGTDVDTIFGDLYSLSERFGDPGGFVPGLQVWIESASRSVKLRASHFARPMRLTAPELCALDLGLAMLRGERPSSEHRAIDGARARIRKALARLPAAELQNGGATHHADLGAAGDGEHLAVVRTAMRAHRKVRVVYRNADATESHARVIAPYGLVAANGAWYAVAHCYERKAVRIFRFDRIESASTTVECFSMPESFSLDALADRGRIFHTEEPETLKVRYSARVARWIAEREGARVAADGSLTLEHPLADVEWALRHVLQYAADAEVQSPAAMRSGVSERLLRVLRG